MNNDEEFIISPVNHHDNDDFSKAEEGGANPILPTAKPKAAPSREKNKKIKYIYEIKLPESFSWDKSDKSTPVLIYQPDTAKYLISILFSVTLTLITSYICIINNLPFNNLFTFCSYSLMPFIFLVLTIVTIYNYIRLVAYKFRMIIHQDEILISDTGSSGHSFKQFNRDSNNTRVILKKVSEHVVTERKRVISAEDKDNSILYKLQRYFNIIVCSPTEQVRIKMPLPENEAVLIYNALKEIIDCKI